ncbi:MAG: MBL fold metallo-hydrolase, partial [Clostridia bacterium]|nr:MBL fold metallo-hydrolase [Clostridia bacterium]
ATCTKNGTETAECENCTETDIREIPNSKTEHSFTNFVPNGDATTEADGTKTAKCDYCTEEKTVTDEGSKLGGDHTHSYTVTVFDPTCTEEGYTLHVCECGNSEYKDSFVAKLEHSFTDYVSDNNATTEADGTKTAKCDRCDATDTIIDEGTKLPSPVDDGKPAKGSEEEIADAKFSIHFLELGNKYTGDSTLIKCGNTEVLIDAGSRQNSAATIKQYVDMYCTDGILEYVIVTHAHQDHIAGFVGNSNGGSYDGILYQYQVGTLIQFGGHKTTSNIYKEYCTAVEYAQSRGTTVYTATQCWYEQDGAKKQYFLDDDETLSMNILYNYYYDHSTSNENNYSVCMLLTNVDGENTTNYLFTGDLEEGGEKRLAQNNNLPEVELFKGGHHGSYTASTDALLSVIKPKNVAICTCCGTTEYTTNVENTFPAQEAIDRIAKYTENIYCTTLIVDYSGGKFTSMNGNIVFYYTDKLKLYCTNNDTILKETDWFKENRTWPEL